MLFVRRLYVCDFNIEYQCGVGTYHIRTVCIVGKLRRDI